MSNAMELADALVDALNTGSFTVPLEAVRAHAPLRGREELATLAVTVVPRSEQTSRLDRSRWQHETTLDVALQQAVAQDDPTGLDALIDLAESVAEHVRRLPPLLERAVVTGVEVDPLWAPEHLRELGVFTSVLRVTLRSVRT